MSITAKRTPTRVQRQRRAGQPGIPVGARYVGRPTRWGNPFSVFGSEPGGGTVYGPDWAFLRARPMSRGVMPIRLPTALYTSHNRVEAAYESAVYLFEALCAVRRRDQRAEFDTWLAPLRGRDLACWCRLGARCHADVLIHFANEEF
ncbi:DUF4326 domain-containing protein [Mycolicibacterium palauense]|uniref:DUF4326 domain-containing protein n=1 Tax=Mycolicibacterium palauense TaxID=2034511 RepID=UPI000BFEB3D2|nr:DUF4326 domain-containing protein [Mycolicibacterium palauense]